jgi:predicted Zn-dependent protease with MMP-like domain
MFRLDLEEFETVVSEAIDSLPEVFRQKLDNVEVVVEDHPPRGLLRRLGRRGLVLGLYQGIPSKRRTSRYGLVMPDKISLYRRNIEMMASSREGVYRQIRKTLLHEIGHHFSLSDQELRDAGF